jgi:hypothetical protein
MVYSDVASESHEVSLVFLKSCIRVLNDLNLASISMFTFPSSGLGPFYLSMLHLNMGK